MPMVTGTPTRTRYAVLVFVYLAAFITYLDRVCLSVAAPAMQAELGISQVGFGWVFTVFYIAYSVFEMPASWLVVLHDFHRPGTQFLGPAGDAHGFRRGGGWRVPHALPRALALVPHPRAGAR